MHEVTSHFRKLAPTTFTIPEGTIQLSEPNNPSTAEVMCIIYFARGFDRVNHGFEQIFPSSFSFLWNNCFFFLK